MAATAEEVDELELASRLDESWGAIRQDIINAPAPQEVMLARFTAMSLREQSAIDRTTTEGRLYTKPQQNYPLRQNL